MLVIDCTLKIVTHFLSLILRIILDFGGFSYSECWVEYVVQVDWHEVEEPLTASCCHGVAGVVNISPCIGTLGETAIG